MARAEAVAMEMHQIRYFLAVCETQNFTRAAEQCHVSQPALTTAIKKLEEEFGGALFHRHRGRATLTELGALTRPYIEQAHGQAEAARSVADSFRLLRRAPLHVGVMATIGPLCLARFLARFQHDYPGIEVELHEGVLEPLCRRLIDEELDLAVLNAPAGLDDRFVSEPLYRERYVVVFPPGHKFAAQDAVRLADVSGEPYLDRLACEMRETVLEVCAQQKVDIYATYRSEREDWIQGMVVAEMGFAFMPEYSITVPGMVSRPLVEPAVERSVDLVAVAGRALSPAATAFRREIRAHSWPG
jgi:DNA-binding transcriptional LysR family regulator